MIGQMKFNEEMALKFGGVRRHATLTEAQIIEAYTRYWKGGETQQAIAESYGTHPSRISRICTGAQFSDITGPLAPNA